MIPVQLVQPASAPPLSALRVKIVPIDRVHSSWTRTCKGCGRRLSRRSLGSAVTCICRWTWH